MAPPVRWLEFPDRSSAAGAAAGLMADAIRSCVDVSGSCSTVVSGGSTPGPCFDNLSRIPLDWSGVTVIPSDERWVPPDHPDSNERLIRERLLVNEAAAAQVLPFYRQGVAPQKAVSLIGQDLAALAAPVGCALLGMGADGHFASLFPDYHGLSRALDPNSDEHCMLVETVRSPHPRISLSLGFLLRSGTTILLISGAEKRRVFESAAAGGTSYPVESLIWKRQDPLIVAWAP